VIEAAQREHSPVMRSLDPHAEFACARDAELHGSPIRHPLWLHACLETIARDADVRLVTAGRGNSVAVAPLVSRGPSRRLEMPGVAELYEPMDFLYSGTSAISAVAEALVSHRIPIFLRRVPADSPVLAALRKAYGGTGVILCRPVSGYPSIALNEDWRRPESKLRPRRAADFRRARRLARSIGEVSYEVHSPGPGELDPLLDEAFEVELRSWKGRNGTDLGNDRLRGPFYRACTARAAQRGILRLGFLRVGRRAAAMQIAIECGERYWLLKSSYDEEFARCSPGVLLLAESIRRAAAGLKSFEFLGTAECWTRIWTRQVRPCVSVRAYPKRLPGLAALAAEAARISVAKLGSFVRST
jgi:CelD/BcsL family acetyltransferase involved in cellulose biosynthesis